MTNMTKDMQKALVRADRAGLVTVSATPEWWREWALSTEWPGYVEVIAQAGEEARDSDVCGVIGRTTRRPCRHNTALYGPCPNHCETPLPIHCATPTKTGGWCRWNLAARGECPKHSDSYDRYMAAVRADEEEELCRQANREMEARKAAMALREAVLGVECPHCDAQPGGDCMTGSGELQPRLHGAREKRWRHRDAASRASCLYCGAVTSDLCRTETGNIATSPHSGRG